MTYTIGKTFAFAASHQLDGMPDGHQCARLHGHNYTVCVELVARQLNPLGMVKDFGELAPVREYIDSTLDHRHLNDVMAVNPTAENVAAELYAVADGLGIDVSAVTVWETPTCFATFRP